MSLDSIFCTSVPIIYNAQQFVAFVKVIDRGKLLLFIRDNSSHHDDHSGIVLCYRIYYMFVISNINCFIEDLSDKRV